MAASALNPVEAAKGVEQKLRTIATIRDLTVTGEGEATIRIAATVTGTASDAKIQAIVDGYKGDGFTVIFERNRRQR